MVDAFFTESLGKNRKENNTGGLAMIGIVYVVRYQYCSLQKTTL
jgi:hypothetical protein